MNKLLIFLAAIISFSNVANAAWTNPAVEVQKLEVHDDFIYIYTTNYTSHACGGNDLLKFRVADSDFMVKNLMATSMTSLVTPLKFEGEVHTEGCTGGALRIKGYRLSK